MRGKVVLVPFPFDDLSSAKVRPAVCLTAPIGPHSHVIVAFVSSRIPDDLLDSDIVLRDSDADFAGTGLRVASTLRLHRLIMTVSTAVLRRELGELAPTRLRLVESALTRLFALDSGTSSSSSPRVR